MMGRIGDAAFTAAMTFLWVVALAYVVPFHGHVAATLILYGALFLALLVREPAARALEWAMVLGAWFLCWLIVRLAGFAGWACGHIYYLGKRVAG